LLTVPGSTAIKNVVVTSSFAAIENVAIPPIEQKGKLYTEEDWNPITQEECKRLDPNESVGFSHPSL
jgi:hypothetical protein